MATLRVFQDNHEVLSNDGEFLQLCRDIFEKLGISNEFDPTNIDRALFLLEDLSEIIPSDKLLSEVMVETVETASEESRLESKALNKQDLKVLLDEFDKHKEIKDAQSLAKEITKNKLLNKTNREQILETISKKIELQTKFLEQGIDEITADRISDRILIIEQTIRPAVNDTVDTFELAQEIVRSADKAQNTEEAVSYAREITANEALQMLVETERATKAIDVEIEKIVEKTVAEIEKGIPLKDNKDKVLDMVRERVEKLVTNPLTDIENPTIGVIQKTGGGLEAVIEQHSLSTSIKEVVGKGVPTTELDKIDKTIKEAATEATELWKADNNSAGKKIGDVMGSLTEKGANANQLKEVLAMRFASTKPGIVGMEEAVIAEYAAEINLSKQGFAENKIEDAAGQASVVKSMLQSPIKIGDSIRAIQKSREILTGNKEMKPLLDVAETLAKNKNLTKSMEMIQKVVHFQESLDKLTGGIITKLTGGTFSQAGKMMGFPALEQFGVSILNKMGLEAMASHIAQFGLEGGLKNILVQLFQTGTVTAVKAGATAGVEAVATGALGTAAGVSTGPPGWVLLAAMLTLELAKNIMGGVYNKAKDVLGGILETLGIGSAKTVDGIKDFFGNAIKYGGMALGGLVTGILALPSALASVPIMSALAPVMIVVFAGLIGYNLFQTASTQISSRVAPQIPEAGGVCVNTGPPSNQTGGNVNCNTFVPDQSGTTVNKANFTRVAEAWRSGGGKNAGLCFNDVVSRANGAGVNADFALWAWLHESGASNYSFANVKDFGIHGQAAAPPMNFTAQITAFLKLDPGSKCLGQPGIGNDYWLGFATNYLTGGCDPNVSVGNYNGISYKGEMESTWKWITSAPMPSSIRTSSGIGNGGIPNSKFTTITEEDGSQTICEVPANNAGGSVADMPLPTLDPSIQIPAGCPNLRPVSGGTITQGPYGKGCSHANMPNAIDFAVGDGTPIIATHDGIARVGSNAVYGNFVDVTGNCGGVTFTTRYAHMPNGGPKVGSNMVVKAGQQIGVVDNTGSSTGSHLHYDFRNISGGAMPNISASVGSKVDLTGFCSR